MVKGENWLLQVVLWSPIVKSDNENKTKLCPAIKYILATKIKDNVYYL